jgi:hypothetical protein
MKTTLGRHVEWLEGEAWRVGHELLLGGIGIQARGGVFVLPYGQTLPEFVETRLLRDRPSHETLNAAK